MGETEQDISKMSLEKLHKMLIEMSGDFVGFTIREKGKVTTAMIVVTGEHADLLYNVIDTLHSRLTETDNN